MGGVSRAVVSGRGVAGRLLDVAARAAWRGVGWVEPNPCVGCVLVDPRGGVVAVGHHRRFGGAHAEVEALGACRCAGLSTRDLAVYCTLEPCGHTGKTGPCADALIAAGVSRVVCARREPMQLASGGAARLRAAGVEVEFTDASRAAVLVGAPYAKRVAEGLPWVVAKWAQTIDGCVATRAGESQWISNAASRRRVHVMRGRVDAVVVGIGTAAADDPMLTARGVAVRRVARRVVLDSELRLALGSRLVESAREVPVTVFCGVEASDGARAAALRERGVEVIGVGGNGRGLDLRRALAELVSRHDATRVLVEAGPRVLGSLMEEGLVDEAHVHVGPLVVGDEGARRAAMGRVVEALGDARRFELLRAARLAGDAHLAYVRSTG